MREREREREGERERERKFLWHIKIYTPTAIYYLNAHATGQYI
jgi:hypothetical protein